MKKSGFKMHIEIMTEKEHDSFMKALMVQGGIKRIRLPEGFSELSIGKQTAEITGIIQSHFTTQRGIITHFGKITGYRFHRSQDEYYDFSVDGELISIHPE